MADLVWSDPDPEKEDFAISPRLVVSRFTCYFYNLPIIGSGAGYTFGSGVVHKFLDQNKMSHILRAHQLCMEGFASLFDKHLSTVWSAPNYCYRCGNSASILEISPGGSMHFNVFEAAPENERDGPSQQAAQNAGGKVRTSDFTNDDITESSIYSATRILPIDLPQGPKQNNYLPYLLTHTLIRRSGLVGALR